MSIEVLYRVQCAPCERYLPAPGLGDQPNPITADADLFITFSSAYEEAVRRGWSAYPLLCPDCAKGNGNDTILVPRTEAS